MKTRIAVWTGLLLMGCAQAPKAPQGREASAAPPAVPRQQIVPLVEHHQHLVGPMLIEPPAPSLPTLSLPAELTRLLQEREQASGKTQAGELYTQDAQVLDVSQAEDHWVRGREAAQRMASAYTPDTHFLPNAYAVQGNTGYIAGVVRTGDAPADDMHFVFGLRKEGRWRIALEYATNKPPRTFSEPITAEKLIGHLDDAGIARAVVLSTAYWVGSPLEERKVENEYEKVKAANDWIVSEVGRYPERLVAFCGVNPLEDYALAEVERCAKLPGVKGMKLHFGNSAVDVKKPEHVAQLRRFMRAANTHRMALVIHLWTLDKSYGAEHSRIFLEQLLPEAPDVTVQIAHLAGAGAYAHDDAMAVFADAISAGDPRMKNVLFDLTTVVTESQPPETLALIARRLRQVGLQRVLFGADTAVSTRPPPILAWATVRRRLPLTDEELRVIASNVAPYLK